jgi:hypothetical protein
MPSLGKLFNYTPAYWEPTDVGIAMEFVLPFDVGKDQFGGPTNSWTVVLKPIGNGVFELWTTYPGSPVLRD